MISIWNTPLNIRALKDIKKKSSQLIWPECLKYWPTVVIQSHCRCISGNQQGRCFLSQQPELCTSTSVHLLLRSPNLMDSVHDEIPCKCLFRRCSRHDGEQPFLTQRHGPFVVNQATYGNSSWVMTAQNVSHFYFLIYCSEPFCLARSRLQNATVIADRNAIKRRRRWAEGGAAFRNNADVSAVYAMRGMRNVVAQTGSWDLLHISIILFFFFPLWWNKMLLNKFSRLCHQLVNTLTLSPATPLCPTWPSSPC